MSTGSEELSAGEEVVNPEVRAFMDPDFAKNIAAGSIIIIYPPWFAPSLFKSLFILQLNITLYLYYTSRVWRLCFCKKGTVQNLFDFIIDSSNAVMNASQHQYISIIQTFGTCFGKHFKWDHSLQSCHIRSPRFTHAKTRVVTLYLFG